MTKRRMVVTSALCCLVALLAVQALSQTHRARPPGQLDHERLQNMTEEEREKEIQKWRAERRLEFERLQNMSQQEKKEYFEKRRKQQERERQRRRRESRKERAEREREMAPLREQREREAAQWRKKFEKEEEEVGGYRILSAKYALGASKEQWKLIQPKLQKVRRLRDQASSGIGAWVVGSGGSGAGPTKPVFKWKRPWKGRPLTELTEAQKLARQLRSFLERENTTPQAFRRKMADLRKARAKETELERPLAEARRELREILSTRQEAVLVLLGWL